MNFLKKIKKHNFKFKFHLFYIFLIFLLTACSAQQSLNNNKSLNSPSSEASANSESKIVEGFTAPTSKTGTPSLKTVVSGQTVVIAKEYRHKALDRYFITTRDADQKLIESAAFINQWDITGHIFSFYENGSSLGDPICRFFNPTLKSHYYTINKSECAQLKQNKDYIDEGVEGQATPTNPSGICPAGLNAVYRLFLNSQNVDDKRYRFTDDTSSLYNLISKGWTNEGNVFCIPQNDNLIITPTPTPTPSPTPVPGTGNITCGNARFSTVAEVKAEYCERQNSCVLVNGNNLCQDKFAPCMSCTAPGYNPLPTPTPSPTPIPSPTPLPSPTPVPTPTPPILPPVAGADLCPSIPVHADLNASTQTIRYLSGAYSGYGGALNYVPVMRDGDQFIIKLTVDPSVTTSGKNLAYFSFSDVGPQRGGRNVTISRSKCDYSTSAFWVSGRSVDGNLTPVPSNAGGALILINDSKPANTSNSEIKIESGVWYINIKNATNSCPANSSCDVVVTWAN